MENSVQLVESEQRFRSLFENNPDLILFQNAAGVILDANSAFLDLLRKSKAEVLNHPLTDFLPPHLHALFNEKLAEAIRGTKVRFDAEVQFADAEPRVFDITKVPLMVDGSVRAVHMVARDISDDTAARNIIQQQARKLNTIFESLTDAFFLMDHNWRFAYVNGEVERLLHTEREKLLGRTLWSVFPKELGGVFHQQFEHALTQRQAVHFEAFLDGVQRWLDVKAFPSEEGLSVYFSDVTDRVKAHQELYRQNNDLQQFTYIVSHNLRAPLANLMGLVDLLSSMEPARPEFGLTLEHLQTNVLQLDGVLQDLNTILAIRDTPGVAPPEQVLLADVLTQAIDTLQEPLEQCGGTVHLSLAEGLSVHGNRAYLYSIFFNLLSNAIKYRSHTRPLRIAVQGTRHPEHGVQVSVADNGSGFDLARAGSDVFKLYKRFHTQQPGRGLGLYLVKNHIETMGGHIEVQSQVDEGTRFVIYLH
ncbi:sensor histidine kinase [Hymenobacter koreensis]|uniref:histidine kinase n=1 Tax=Hymenobacter koreensis TaxID=1084523 RepID=A0ABP8JPC7_9BACT